MLGYGHTEIYINFTTQKIDRKIHLQPGGGGGEGVALDTELQQKVSVGKRSLSIIHVLAERSIYRNR